MATVKEFVRETLAQIAEAIDEHNAALGEEPVSGRVEGSFDAANNRPNFVHLDGRGERIGTLVEFDVAITSGEEENAKGGAEVKVMGLFKAGGGIDSLTANSSVSRVKFTLAMALPKHLGEDKEIFIRTV